jgi:hypothetical protein
MALQRWLNSCKDYELARWKHIRPFFRSPEKIWLFARNAIVGRAVRIVCYLAVITIISTALHAQTDDFSSVAASADAARRQGDIPRAIELYRKATETNPNWTDGWWFLGILQYDQNQYEPARDALTHYLQLTPKAAPALALRGICEFNLGAYEQALQDLEKTGMRRSSITTRVCCSLTSRDSKKRSRSSSCSHSRVPTARIWRSLSDSPASIKISFRRQSRPIKLHYSRPLAMRLSC